MTSKIDLDNAAIRSNFFQYLLPSVFAMTIKSLFIIVDLMFVGHGVGVAGLGAISLTVPFFSFSAALALMIGLGGATIMSIQFGRGDNNAGQQTFEQSVILFLVIAGTLIAASLYWLEEIVSLMGAEGELARASMDYLSVMLIFFLFQGGQFVLAGFVRNDTNPNLAMRAMITGFMTNIILDYLFIFEFSWGIKGAALATGLSQALIFIILLSHFIQGKGRLRLRLSGGYSFQKNLEILKVGSPNFFIESTAAITALAFNYVLLTQFTDLHVTAYSIVMNVGLVVLFVLAGIGQACQPIISYNYGAGRTEKVKDTVYLGLRYSIVAGIIATLLALTSAEFIVAIFTNENSELISLASTALRIYLSSAIFMGMNIVIATLFQSVEKPKTATVLSLSRGLVFVLAGLVILPVIFPANGIWGSVLLAETITLGISLYAFKGFLGKFNKVN